MTQPAPLHFFVDRCFPVALSNALAALESVSGNSITYLDDRFPPDTADIEWLRNVGKWKPKPFILSGDTRILRKRDEAAVLAEQDLMFVCLAAGWTEFPIREFAWKFFKAWPGIIDAVSNCAKPSILIVNNGGSLKTELKQLTRDLASR